MTHQLFKLGLVSLRGYGYLSQYERFSFREPGWGRLILAAEVVPLDQEKLLFKTASGHPATAAVLNTRLGQQGLFNQSMRLWKYVNSCPQQHLKLIPETSLTYIARLIAAARNGEQFELADQYWQALEREPDKFAAHAWETSLEHVARFLSVAKEQGRNTAVLWKALEREPDKFAAHAWETSLEHVARFLSVAKEQERNTAVLWKALEREPDKFAAHAWETSLEHVARFLSVAKEQERNTAVLWKALEREPDKFAAHAWETSLEHVARFPERGEGTRTRYKSAMGDAGA